MKPLLTDPRIKKIFSEILKILKYIQVIRKLLHLDYKSKDLLFVKENLEIPALYLLDKFLKCL